jgi:UTP-glucose-1-phosphate uridylyltransferase
MKITQAILPVAGLGTRFLPWTKVVPKELLPIGNVPIIALLVDECLDVGITDICFVISEGKESIAHYFMKNEEFQEELKRRKKLHLIEDLERYDEVNFHVVYQKEQLGDGHALYQAHDWVDSDFIGVLFGDDLFHGAARGLMQLKEAYESSLGDSEGAIAALQNIDRSLTSKYGIVEVEEEGKKNPRLKKLKGMVEKPEPEDAPSTLGIVGRYIIPRSTFKVLPKVSAGQGGEIRLIDALIEQLKTIPIYGLECEGTRIDTGTPEGYREAVEVMTNNK